MCERIWFYFGDHKRDIQGRMTILRDYLPEIRDNLEKNRRKFKPLVYQAAGRGRDAGDRSLDQEASKEGRSLQRDHRQVAWRNGKQDFVQERIEAGPPSAMNCCTNW